jgi:hypothetical protein
MEGSVAAPLEMFVRRWVRWAKSGVAVPNAQSEAAKTFGGFQHLQPEFACGYRDITSRPARGLAAPIFVIMTVSFA